jgi:hypothetical protein
VQQAHLVVALGEREEAVAPHGRRQAFARDIERVRASGVYALAVAAENGR